MANAKLIRLIHDDDASIHREINEMLGEGDMKLHTWHRNKNLGVSHGSGRDESPAHVLFEEMENAGFQINGQSVDSYLEQRLEQEEADYDAGESFGKSEEELIEEIVRAHAHEALSIHPVHMYEHGGVALSTSSFHDPFDSGQLGFVVIPRNSAEAQYHQPDQEGQDLWRPGQWLEEQDRLLQEPVRQMVKMAEAIANGAVYTFQAYEVDNLPEDTRAQDLEEAFSLIEGVSSSHLYESDDGPYISDEPDSLGGVLLTDLEQQTKEFIEDTWPDLSEQDAEKVFILDGEANRMVQEGQILHDEQEDAPGMS